jgi:hypothetical protein
MKAVKIVLAIIPPYRLKLYSRIACYPIVSKIHYVCRT